MTMNRQLPQDMELEMCVLGGVMLEPVNAYPAAAEVLTPESFYLDGHRLIFRTMGELYASDRMPDSDTVMAALRANGKLNEAGGAIVILNMLNSVPSAASVSHHARIVADHAMRRAIIRVAYGAADMAYGCEMTPDEVIHELTGNIDILNTAVIAPDAIYTLEDLARDTAEDLAKQLSGNTDALVTTGVPGMDALTGGWQPGDLWIWAARPNTGKTRVLLYMLIKSAMEGNRIGFVSLDMGRTRLMKYALSTALSLTGKRSRVSEIFSPLTFGPDGEAVIRDECFQLDIGGNLLVVPDMRSNSIRSIETVIRQLVKAGVSVVAIDQAQNVSEYNPESRESISRVVQAFKRMARKFGITVVLVHQINRGGADRPRMHNLKDSGVFEEYSDFVVILHDPMRAIIAAHGECVEDHTGNYRVPKADDEDISRKDEVAVHRKIEVILDKSRNDITKIVAMWFDYQQGVKT